MIVYIVDALRPDRLGCYGYSGQVSPALDSLAGDGVLFQRCFTCATWTRPVAASILTGVYPTVHGVMFREDEFAGTLPRMPEVFAEAGFTCGLFSAFPQISAITGFSRGFDTVEELHRSRQDATRATVEALLSWIRVRREQDTFCLIWMDETHAPYSRPVEEGDAARLAAGAGLRNQIARLRMAGPRQRGQFLESYEGAVRTADENFRYVSMGLKDLGCYDQSIIALTSDHGEAFCEHGEYTHGHAPYEELLHVPLILKLPGNQLAGRRVDALTSVLDIFPTLLECSDSVDLSTRPTHLQGCSQFPFLAGYKRPRSSRYLFSETQFRSTSCRYESVRGERWKYICRKPPRANQSLAIVLKRKLCRPGAFVRLLRRLSQPGALVSGLNSSSLFDLADDPGESRNLVRNRPERSARCEQLLRGWRNRNRRLREAIPVKKARIPESDLVALRLERLGYL